MASFAQKKSKTLETRRRTKQRNHGQDESSDDEDEPARPARPARVSQPQLTPVGGASAGAVGKASVAKRAPSLWPESERGVPSELAVLRKQMGVLVRSDDANRCPRPVSFAADPSLPPLFAEALRGLGPPTAVQSQAWPALLAGLDILCLAETGSGKTLAYLLPIMARAHAAGRGAGGTCFFTHASVGAAAAGGGASRKRAVRAHSLAPSPVALVLAPTRELASQIALVARRLRKATGLHAQAVYGGVARAEQLAALSEGCDVLVGTPGRVLDLCTEGTGRPGVLPAPGAHECDEAAEGEAAEPSARSIKKRRKLEKAEAKESAAEGADLDLGCLVQLVVDEADKMLAQGFKEQVDRILARAHEQRTARHHISAGGGDKTRRGAPALLMTSLFSSTMPGKLQQAAQEWTSGAVFVRATRRASDSDPAASAERTPSAARALEQPRASAPLEPGSSAAEAEAALEGGARGPVPARAEGSDAASLATRVSADVSQVVQVTAEHKKGRKLLAFLKTVAAADAAAGARNKSRVLIFTNKVASTEAVTTLLQRAGLKCAALHGDRRQKEREAALADFRSGKTPLLVATDVAGRGLDIPKLPHVVCYDFPGNLESYVNRVGRVGRAGAKGHALSFFTRNLAKLAPDLLRLLEAAGQPVDSYLRQLAVAVEAGREAEGDAIMAAAEASGGLD